MIESSTFTYYNVLISLLTGFGVLYFLFFRPTIVEYRRFLLLTVFGLLTFLVGGPIVELLLPPLVHWVHGFAAIVVILGLYDPLENDSRRQAWADVLLQEPVTVRQQASWMLPIDDAILGLFHSTELVLTPSIIGYNIDYSREEVNRRLGELEHRGFVARPERGKYRITDLGRQYIEGSASRGALTRLRHGLMRVGNA